ncbi:MAG: ECF transporter S component [bacterium]|nr:ECF transporter S component [bacterium]
MNKKMTSYKLTIVALAAVMNILGGHLALALKLPIYLDSIGTVLIGAILGPVYGIIPGLLSGLITGVTGDIYSIYFMPVQLVTGIMTGILFRTAWVKGKKMPLGVLAITLPGTFVSASISAILFGGVTSSGSSMIVFVLRKLGVSMTASVFAVQIITDYADRFLAVAIVAVILISVPREMIVNLRGGKENGSLQQDNE